MFPFVKPKRPALDAQQLRLVGGTQTLMLGSSTNSKRLALSKALRADVTLIVLTRRSEYWEHMQGPAQIHAYDVLAAGSGGEFNSMEFAKTLRAAVRRARACIELRLPVILFDGFGGDAKQLIEALRQINLSRAHRIVDLDTALDDRNGKALFAEFSQVVLFAMEHQRSIALIKESLPDLGKVQLDQIWRLPPDRFHVINFDAGVRQN